MAASGGRRRRRKKGNFGGDPIPSVGFSQQQHSSCGERACSPPKMDQEADIEEKKNTVLTEAAAAATTDVVKRRIRRNKKRRGKQKQQPDKDPKYLKQGLWFENEEEARKFFRDSPVPWPEDYERLKLELEQRRRRRNLKSKQQQNKEQPFQFQQGGDFPDIVFLLHSTDRISWDSNKTMSYVYALDTTTTTTNSHDQEGDDDSDPLPLKLLFQFPTILGMDFVSIKSTLYGIGGVFDYKTGKFLTDFLICDLTDWRNRDNFKWEDGPALKGPKPFPVLSAINGLIYALAGCNLSRSEIPKESVFEVFEPGLGWKVLPPPPFHACYTKQGGPFIRFNTVIDTTIYVGLDPHLDLYSYNVATGVWKHISLEGGSCNPIPRNLLKCYWSPSSEIANNMVFQCTSGCSTEDDFCNADVAPQVYAWNLAAEEELVENTPAAQEEVAAAAVMEESYPASTEDSDCDGGEDSSSTVTDEAVVRVDSDYLSWDEFPPSSDGEVVSSDSDDYCMDSSCLGLCLPVRGLKAMTGLVRGFSSTRGFVAHLANDVYCLVYFYLSPRWSDFRIRVCTFQVVEKPSEQSRFIRATILQSAMHSIAIDIGLQYSGKWYVLCSFNLLAPNFTFCSLSFPH